MMMINNVFELKELVYCITDNEQSVMIITAIKVTADGGILYTASVGTRSADFYDCELSREVNELIKVK